MNLIQCNKKHFYDQDKYNECPHCNSGVERNDNLTVPVKRSEINDAQTMPLKEHVQQAIDINVQIPIEDRKNDGATVAMYKVKDVEPVVGWLVCTEGNHSGEFFKLKTGRNFIGRSRTMDIAISKDDTVSRERHAAVIYEPKNLMYLVQTGDSSGLCYLNDNVVLNPEKLKINDVITIGDTKLMFFPCCNEVFNWGMLKDKKESDQ